MIKSGSENGMADDGQPQVCFAAVLAGTLRFKLTTLVREMYTGQFLAQSPQLTGEFSTHRPGSHTTELGGIAGHRNSDVTIFAINPAKSFKPTARSTPHAGCRPLFRRLLVVCRVDDGSSLLI